MGEAPSDALASTRLPNLLIVGVGKAGTTSLFFYLSQHPDICPSAQKEPRYFRLGDDEELPPIESYARHFAACRNERFVLEASPQYFKGGPRSIELIREHLGRPRVIVDASGSDSALMVRIPIQEEPPDHPGHPYLRQLCGRVRTGSGFG